MDLQLRKSYLGGTDISVICGFSPYKTPYELWQEKTSTSAPLDIDNDYMALGRELEDGAARLYASKNGLQLIDALPEPLRHPEHSFLACNYDRLFINEAQNALKRLMEVKTTVRTVYKSWGGGVPDTYWCQIQHYLGILNRLMGVNSGIFVVLVLDERRIYDIEVELDQPYVDQLWAYAVWWWQHHVIDGNEPDLTAKEFDALPHINGSSVLADDQAIAAVMELKGVKRQIKALEARKSVLENDIKTYIRTSERLITSTTDVLATYMQQNRSSIDTKLLKANHPELYARYEKQAAFRVLRTRGDD